MSTRYRNVFRIYSAIALAVPSGMAFSSNCVIPGPGFLIFATISAAFRMPFAARALLGKGLGSVDDILSRGMADGAVLRKGRLALRAFRGPGRCRNEADRDNEQRQYQGHYNDSFHARPLPMFWAMRLPGFSLAPVSLRTRDRGSARPRPHRRNPSTWPSKAPSTPMVPI